MFFSVGVGGMTLPTMYRSLGNDHTYFSFSFIEFYLILNVAVGGTNGWFPDVQGDKPWLDASQGM
jgi:hypothetical protein